MSERYEVVIGLEVHAQLLTDSKMFCGCSAAYNDAPPNSHVCPVCLGLPGVLPVINRRAVEYTVMTALALHCSIPEFSKFDRKNYPYPDLMKGYQISQYDVPLSAGGWVEIETEQGRRRIGVTRVHLEEDTAKLLHRGRNGDKYSLIDVNRSGVPLMEIVSEPDLRSPEEAGQYLTRLRQILQYLGVNSGRMEEGSLRCDANVSLRPVGATYLNPKVEVKNMNSIRALVRALAFEVERQTRMMDAGETVRQETRGWVEERGVTVLQRSKEEAHDYRYFPEPDLPPLLLSREWVEELRSRLPELPDERKARLMEEYQLNEYDAGLIVSTRAMAELFEEAVALSHVPDEQRARRAKAVANWLVGDYQRLRKEREHGEEEEAPALAPGQLVELLDLLDGGVINGTVAKQVFTEIVGTELRPREIVERRGLGQISDGGELEQVAREVVGANPAAVADYHGGKEQALKFLVGQMMRATKGRAKPDVAAELLRSELERVSSR